MNSAIKGNQLEEAVEQIESTIFRNNPSLKNAKFTIDRKKIIISNGVKHEIDLYVEVDPGNDLNSIFIFECKNWDAKSIGKNEILEFEEKIKVTNATKGFFVGSNFGRYAIAQAKLNQRVVLLNAESSNVDLNIFPTIVPSFFEDTSKRLVDMDVAVRRAKEGCTPGSKIELEEINYKGKKFTKKEFLEKFLQIIVDEKIKIEFNNKYVEGIYKFKHKKTFEFKSGKIFINNCDVGRITFLLEFEIEIIKPKVVSKFDIENRGRVVNYELRKNNGEKIVNIMLTAIK